MSSDATDPVKALREFAALPPKWPGILDDRLASIMRDLSAFARTCTAVDDGFARELDAFGKARALLAAAPALLARIEAGEGLLREARGFIQECQSGSEVADRVDAFLAGKEANRGLHE